MNEKIFRYSCFAFSAFIMGLIFYFSMQNSAESNFLSNSLLQKIVFLFEKNLNYLPIEEQLIILKKYHIILRKSAHFGIYALLGFFVCGFWGTFNRNKKVILLFFSVAFTFFYALTDEFHQMFVSGRSAQFTDVLIDTSGGILGSIIMAIFLYFIFWRKGNEKSKQQQSNL